MTRVGHGRIRGRNFEELGVDIEAGSIACRWLSNPACSYCSVHDKIRHSLDWCFPLCQCCWCHYSTSFEYPPFYCDPGLSSPRWCHRSSPNNAARVDVAVEDVAMNPGFGPEMFPLYEGVDAEYVAGAPDVSYPVEYGYANFGDDLDDDTLSDIYIEDEAYPDEDYYVNDFENEPWLPYNPSKDAGSGGAQQQIVLGGGIPIHPPTGELTESYCRFYPGECSGKVNVLPQVNSTCIAGANGSDPNCMGAEGTDRGLYPALNSVDLSGVGMVLLIALLLLIGVHFGWDSDKGKQAKGPGEGESISQTPPPS